jgi:hypothetical protein
MIWLSSYSWCSKLGSTSISASVPTSVQNGTLGMSDDQSSVPNVSRGKLTRIWLVDRRESFHY